jgi:hypothetical protein
MTNTNCSTHYKIQQTESSEKVVFNIFKTNKENVNNINLSTSIKTRKLTESVSVSKLNCGKNPSLFGSSQLSPQYFETPSKPKRSRVNGTEEFNNSLRLKFDSAEGNYNISFSLKLIK